MVERKKRGLGRGLGALIPDANSNDRPVDVFFSGGNSEDGRREGEQKTSRTARTDPAASMQSSRRRKSKAGADSQTSSASTTKSTARKATSGDSSGTQSSKRSAEVKKTASADKPAAGNKAATAEKPATTKKTSSGASATGSKSGRAGKTTPASKASAASKKSTSKTAASTESSKSKATKPASAASKSSASTKRAASKAVSTTSTAAPAPTDAPAVSSGQTASSEKAVSHDIPTSEDAKVTETAAPAVGSESAVTPDVADNSETAAAPDDVRETHPGVYTSSGNSDAADDTKDMSAHNTTNEVGSKDGSAAAQVQSTSDSSPSLSDPSTGAPDSSIGAPEPATGASEKSTDDTSVADTPEVEEPDSDEDPDPYEGVESIPDTEFGEIDVDLIDANPRQPRTVFDEDLLAELVHSIREIGVLQPVVVRQKPTDRSRFELIMGERRLRATKDAGLSTIPAIIRYVEDTDLLRDALLENLHRAELNPLEEAAAYGQLLEDFGCTQEELSERIGRSRPQISNTLRLLRLPPLVQRRVAAGVISAGHARAILGLRDPEHMEVLAQRIVAEGLSVRASEEAVVLLNRGDSINVSRATSKVSPEFLAVAERLGDRLDTKVNITIGKRKGKLSVEFANQQDLDRILSLLGIAEGEAG